MNYDHVLLLGFGAPQNADEVMPFLEEVTRGRGISHHRLQEVAKHYESFGGRSPYKQQVFEIAETLRKRLEKEKLPLPVFTGMRNSHPRNEDVLKEIRDAGHQKGIAVILAPHRSPASCYRYKDSLSSALAQGGCNLEYHYLDPWYDDSEYVKAQSELLQAGLRHLKGGRFKVIFSAHSIPVSMEASCRECCYSEEFRRTCELVAAECGLKQWGFGYQSRSGNPNDPWLKPPIKCLIREAAREGASDVLLVPLGFLVDNAEVIYDLDVEARGFAEAESLHFHRVATLQQHPRWIAMLAKRIDRMAGPAATG